MSNGTDVVPSGDYYIRLPAGERTDKCVGARYQRQHDWRREYRGEGLYCLHCTARAFRRAASSPSPKTP